MPDERPDIIELLIDQHDVVRDVMSRIMICPSDEREAPFEMLARLLAVHETA